MEILEDAIKHGLSKLGYEGLRGPQHEVIKAYAIGKDVFLSAPTAYGIREKFVLRNRPLRARLHEKRFTIQYD